MTDEPKYMYEVNLVRFDHAKHQRSTHCKALRKDKDTWYIKAINTGFQTLGVCTVCGKTVETY
jgi:hypothetical protein